MKTLIPFLLSTTLLGCAMTGTHNLNQPVAKNAEAAFNEPFRPQIHFTPPSQWMNDPNGMFFLDGEYHLFYQHNPDDNVWGPMHWGHAVSRDLVHWEHLPIALFPDEKGTIFSGSAVVDWNNTSGLGSKENPAIVAFYTYHNAEREQQGLDDFQTQAMAYSLDKGRTWNKYQGNPVITNPGIRDFRDPKVTWHAGTERWIMALAQKDHVGFYSSPNLIDWSLESTFGENIGSHGGVWECPELLLVPVEGTDNLQYVLLVSINPGGPNGGSATQYFVGDFDGKNFTLSEENQSLLAPTPAQFPTGQRFDDFEQGFKRWQAHSQVFTTVNDDDEITKQRPPTGYEGRQWASSFSDGDAATGTLDSETFIISQPFINFLIGGGNFPDRVGMQLLVDGKVVRTATGANREALRAHAWNVQELKGKKAKLRIIDKITGSWGHTYIDNIVFAQQPANNLIEPAQWLDFGTDNYAGVTFFTTPSAAEQRSVFIGWMSNWLYANHVPTEAWRSAMTLPRTLHLVQTENGLKVASRLVEELDSLAVKSATTGRLMPDKPLRPPVPDSPAVRYQFTIDMTQAEVGELVFSNDAGEKMSLTVNASTDQLILDRGKAGVGNFHDSFDHPQVAPLLGSSQNVNMDIVIDQASVEIVVNDGLSVMTAIFFPREGLLGTLTLKGNNVVLTEVNVTSLSSIWSH